jgi:hypothetical protein
MKKFISLLIAMCISVVALSSCEITFGEDDIEETDINTDVMHTAKLTENETEKKTEPPLEVTEGLSLEPLGDGNYQLSGMGRCEEHDIVIPADHKGGAVTKIRDKAFYSCFDILSAVIPNSVTEIGEFAFSCSNLSAVIIPDSVTVIGRNAFSGCSRLKEISLPKQITVIEEDLLCQCEGLTEIIIPENVKSIKGSAFSECISLTSVSFPDGLRSIENYAFSGCESLEKITLPKSLKAIGDGVFAGCDKLSVIYYEGTKQEWEAIEKHYNWDNDSSFYLISCSDGYVS